MQTQLDKSKRFKILVTFNLARFKKKIQLYNFIKCKNSVIVMILFLIIFYKIKFDVEDYFHIKQTMFNQNQI